MLMQKITKELENKSRKGTIKDTKEKYNQYMNKAKRKKNIFY